MEDSQFGQTTFDYDTYNAIYDKAISIISMATQSEKNLCDKLAKHRYPQAIELDEATTKNAISQAEQVKIWAEKIIAEKSNMQ